MSQTKGSVFRRTWQQVARLRQSLKARLLLVFLLLALSMTAVFMLGMQRGFSQGWRELVRPLTQDYAKRIFDQIGVPPKLEEAQRITRELPLMISIQGPSINWVSHAQMAERAQREAHRREWVGEGGQSSFFSRQTSDGHRLELGLAVESWRERPRRLGWFVLGGLLLLTTLTYFFIARMLRPIQAIRQAAQRFGQGQFEQKLIPKGKDELARLGEDLNLMGKNLEQMIQTKRALLLAMSHELRSPLTRAKLHAELLPDATTRRESLLRDLNEMSDLINSLLESERLSQADAKDRFLQLESVELASLIMQVMDELEEVQPRAARIRVDLEAAPTTWMLDALRFKILLRNLLANALDHGDKHSGENLTGAANAPSCSLQISQGQLLVRIRDFGAGVPDEQISSLGEAFWRADSSRTRDSGGVGLGLYLCRLIAQAHGGTISFSPAQPGLLVEVRL